MTMDGGPAQPAGEEPARVERLKPTVYWPAATIPRASGPTGRPLVGPVPG